MFADDTNLFYKHKNMSILFFNVNYELIMSSCKLWYSQGKSTLKWNSNTFEKYEYGHLGGWYIKSTLYTRLLNWSKIFEKINYSCWQNSVLCDRCILYSPFHMLWHSDRAVLYGNVAFSFLVLSTKQSIPVFWKRFLFFRKFVSKLKYWKRSKFLLTVT